MKKIITLSLLVLILSFSGNAMAHCGDAEAHAAASQDHIEKDLLFLAKFSASFMKFLSAELKLSFLEDIDFIYKLNKIFFFSKISINRCKSYISNWI